LVRAEIAVELGVTLDELQARATGDAGLARALTLADEAALAWWARLPREAFAAKARFNAAAWRAAVQSRFGAASNGPTDEAHQGVKRARAAFVLPFNFREARWADHQFDDHNPTLERALDDAYERYAAEVEALMAERRRSNDD
jgi:hypothetical protein